MRFVMLTEHCVFTINSPVQFSYAHCDVLFYAVPVSQRKITHRESHMKNEYWSFHTQHCRSPRKHDKTQ